MNTNIGNMQNNDLVLLRLVDGKYALGKMHIVMGILDHATPAYVEVVDVYSLIVRGQAPDGSIVMGIVDFYAPFIQDGKGVTLHPKDWIGEPQPMPEGFRQEYTQKVTGLIVTNQMPAPQR